MKPCKICKQPKSWHDGDRLNSYYGWDGWPTGNHDKHEFQMDNLAYLERKVKVKELEEKHRKLNYCQICNLVKKSPFGICKECSEILIKKSLDK